MKTKIILMLSIIFSILFIIPQTNHIYGLDTVRNYELANDIAYKKYVSWNSSPFAIMGLEPASYPEGGLIVLSSVSSITNISSEYIILIMSICINVCAFILVYLIGKYIFKKEIYAIILAILFTTSRIIISLTTWSYSVRSLLIVYALTVSLLSFKLLHAAKYRNKYIFLALILTTIAISIHRMSPLILIFLIAYIIVDKINKYNFCKTKTFLLIILGVVIAEYLFFYGILRFPIVDGSIYIHSSNILAKTISILFRYVMYTGATILFVVLSLGYFLKKKEIEKQDLFIIIILLLNIPFIGNLVYSINISLIIITILSSMGIIYILERIKNHNRYIIYVLFFCIIFIQILPYYVTVENKNGSNDYSIYLTHEDYTVSRFIDELTDKYTVILSNDVTTNRILSYSDNAVPLGSNNDMINDEKITKATRAITFDINKIISSHEIQTGKIKSIFLIKDPYFEGQSYYPGIDTEYFFGNNNAYLSNKIQKEKNIKYILLTKNEISQSNNFFKYNKYNFKQIFSTKKYNLIEI